MKIVLGIVLAIHLCMQLVRKNWKIIQRFHPDPIDSYKTTDKTQWLVTYGQQKLQASWLIPTWRLSNTSISNIIITCNTTEQPSTAGSRIYHQKHFYQAGVRLLQLNWYLLWLWVIGRLWLVVANGRIRLQISGSGQHATRTACDKRGQSDDDRHWCRARACEPLTPLTPTSMTDTGASPSKWLPGNGSGPAGTGW